MQRTLRLTLLLSAILLACVSGCTDRGQILHGSVKFDIDGAEYWVCRHSQVNRHGRLILSCLVLYPPRLGPQPSGTTTYNSQWDSYTVTLHSDGKKVDAKTETLYFIQDKKIVFEKSYQELGIDASRLTTDTDDMRVYLTPILEKLIREHVLPQDTETEEQEE